MKRIVQVVPLSGYRVEVTFGDGVHGVADLSHLAGKGVFSAWVDPVVFNGVRVGDAGELIWDCGLDLCPDSLYLMVTKKHAADLFPALKHETLHA